MSKRWESPADDPDPPECDVDEECEGGDDCTSVSEGPGGCECACHKEVQEVEPEEYDPDPGEVGGWLGL